LIILVRSISVQIIVRVQLRYLAVVVTSADDISFELSFNSVYYYGFDAGAARTSDNVITARGRSALRVFLRLCLQRALLLMQLLAQQRRPLSQCLGRCSRRTSDVGV